MTPALQLPADLRHMDDDEKALAGLPALADRMVYHTNRLRIIQYVAGIEGVTAYKAKFPEAKGIQTRATTIAFQPKPKGYREFLMGLVETWFISDVALAETNKADVERLNRAMHPRRFNPANHFSKPLSRHLLGQLADVFAKHGAHLDTSKPLSMANVRAAVKVAKRRRLVGRPYAGIGYIADGQLMVRDQSFATEQHNGHECIRVRVNGSRVRLRLDALAEFLTLAALDQSPSTLLRSSIGEVVPDDADASGADPLADTLPENWPEPIGQSSGELAPAAADPPSLRERIAALKALQAPHSMACADGADPLAF